MKPDSLSTIRDYFLKAVALKRYVGFFLVDLFILIVILINALISFWYLYTPSMGRVIVSEVKKPLLNEALLKTVVKKIDENSQNLSKKIQETYPDPFE